MIDLCSHTVSQPGLHSSLLTPSLCSLLELLVTTLGSEGVIGGDK